MLHEHDLMKNMFTEVLSCLAFSFDFKDFFIVPWKIISKKVFIRHQDNLYIIFDLTFVNETTKA
jgi:hypothetical protein